MIGEPHTHRTKGCLTLVGALDTETEEIVL